MRQLVTADIFKMSKILKKVNLNIKTTVLETTKNEEGEEIEVYVDKPQSQLGAEVILEIAEKLHLVEKEVNDLLGNLTGMTGKEFSQLPITETMKHFEEFKELEGIDSFLTLAGKQTKK